ncbi:hypothetical protein ACF1DW_04360 [Streptomyces sp. NPDC014603]|uniref:hypothetical protein n=1 Tax=Streptomyces sp. NPDC014603 TaxID=3364873 RepID=UPI0036F9790D
MVRHVLVVLEVVFALTVLVGVALVYVPAALILGGLAGVVAVERALSEPPPASREEVRP